MLNKISFLGKIKEQVKQKANYTIKIPDTPNDTFTKEKKMQNKTDFTKNEIISILSSGSFNFLIADLLETGKYSDSVNAVAFLENETMGKYVGMALENFDSLNTERYNFTIPEFKEMLFEILNNNISKNPNKADEYTALYQQLLEKIKSELE